MELILVAGFLGGVMAVLGTIGLIVEKIDRCIDDSPAPPSPETRDAMEQVTNRVRRRVQESCLKLYKEEQDD